MPQTPEVIYICSETPVLLSTAYLAPVSYYCRLRRYRKIRMEQWEHYIKQTYRNRCVIASESGPLPLSVPIEKTAPGAPVKDIRISGHGNWRRAHWQALLSAYENTPFFEYYADDIAPLYEERSHFLLDFNESLRETICRLIGIENEVEYTECYVEDPGMEDCRQLFSPKHKREDTCFHPVSYYQVFAGRNGFLPDLSIVDLLFNMGPESLLVLNKCLE